MQKFTCLVILVFLSSCSLFQSIALKTTASIINKGSDEVLTESNWELFNNATPANLKLIEGLWYGDQENTELLTMLIKGYAAYGFGSKETIALSDILLEEDSSQKINQAIMIYEKAIYYGLKYLEIKGISEKVFFGKSFSLRLSDVFNKELSSNDHIAIFYFAQALGSRINIDRGNLKYMASLSQVKEMIKWVCTLDKLIERQSCLLLEAVMEASTPSLLGGSQRLAKKLFKQTIKLQPFNLLARINYIQYHLIPVLEEDEFASEMENLGQDLSFWKSYVKGKKSKHSLIYENNRNFNLFNSIANEKYKVIKKLNKELF